MSIAQDGSQFTCENTRIAGVPWVLSMTGTPVCMPGAKIEGARDMLPMNRFMQYHGRFWPALIAMDARHIPTKTCGGLANQTLRCSRLFQASAPYSRVWTPAVPLLEQEGGVSLQFMFSRMFWVRLPLQETSLAYAQRCPLGGTSNPVRRMVQVSGALMRMGPRHCQFRVARTDDHSGAAVSPKLLPHPRVPGPPTT